MSFLDTLRARIGNDAYWRLEREAEKEVALAKQMPLRDQYGQESYYAQRFLLGELLDVCDNFEKLGLRILPTDIVTILFRCKLLFAANSEDEYAHRVGGLFPHLAGSSLFVKWSERTEGVDAVIDRHFARLETEFRERTLVVHMDTFNAINGNNTVQQFFDQLFAKLAVPFISFFEDADLIEKQKRLDPGLRTYDSLTAKRFFSAPSIGFTASGSREYCFWYSSMWLRTFLNCLRIASYIYPGQRHFGREVQMCAPSYPVFLGERTYGMYKWDEDKNESWAKIPDGCLFLSFGYRGLSKMWLDKRVFPKIENFLLDHRAIFSGFTNPWNARSISDIAPTLDILSSATQIPDLGAKILLVYCCLEHLFVPTSAYTENKRYIVGGMNALRPQLLSWFDDLYKLRCAYAHKGFVLRDNETMALVADSMKNVMALLVAKLSV